MEVVEKKGVYCGEIISYIPTRGYAIEVETKDAGTFYIFTPPLFINNYVNKEGKEYIELIYDKYNYFFTVEKIAEEKEFSDKLVSSLIRMANKELGKK